MSVSPNDFTSTVGFAFLWSTVVGVTGVVLLIVGIVLLVKVNGKRRRITQEAMLSAVR